MRGVIALAAAISLPETLANGSPFLQRSLIIFLTFSVILVTLVVQGLTLPIVIRALGIGGSADTQRSTAEARRLVIRSALAYLGRMQDASPEFAEIDQDIARHYTQRMATLGSDRQEPNPQDVIKQARYLDVSRQLLNVERETALRLRTEGRISNEALREIERDLDLSVVRLNTMQRPPQLTGVPRCAPTEDLILFGCWSKPIIPQHLRRPWQFLSPADWTGSNLRATNPAPLDFATRSTQQQFHFARTASPACRLVGGPHNCIA